MELMEKTEELSYDKEKAKAVESEIKLIEDEIKYARFLSPACESYHTMQLQKI